MGMRVLRIIWSIIAEYEKSQDFIKGEELEYLFDISFGTYNRVRAVMEGFGNTPRGNRLFVTKWKEEMVKGDFEGTDIRLTYLCNDDMYRRKIVFRGVMEENEFGRMLSEGCKGLDYHGEVLRCYDYGDKPMD